MFSDYFKLGIDHILDPNGYDHILFVSVLCALYNPSQWKKILILVTAFTLGHSFTLALASLAILNISATLIERLIPITIILTGVFNIYFVLEKGNENKVVLWNYLLALTFGLIHGLGFSNYFKAILGGDDDLIKPLFAFNLGVEAGQIAIVAVVMAIGFVIMNVLRLPKKYWTISISIAGILVAAWLLLDR